MLTNDPLCATSHWFEDFVGAAVFYATSDLPLERINAATAKGSTMSQADEAARLLNEVIEFGWNSRWTAGSQTRP